MIKQQQKLKTPAEALTVALFCAITARSDEKHHEAMKYVNDFWPNCSCEEIEQAKIDALKMKNHQDFSQ
jgi:hypothetical protein